MKLCLAALTALGLAGWGLGSQARFDNFNRDLQNPDMRVVVIQSARIVWQRGKITEAACDEPAIADRIPQKRLDTPAPEPSGATIRQVLENRADGTPGEEVLENRDFFLALHTHGKTPSAIAFAARAHGSLGWLSQDYAGERVLWCHTPALLIVRVPSKDLALVAATHFKAAEDGNIARSLVALAFFKDVAGMNVLESDELIDHGMLRQALDQFPGLESTPDVSLLHILSQRNLPETEASATAVIQAHPTLPTAWFYYAQFLENNKRYREAAACFEKITMHAPPWHNWTVAAAKKELTYLKTY
jgi:tetratricopeptide (TPR) repeat protein